MVCSRNNEEIKDKLGMENVIDYFENKLLEALEFRYRGEPQQIKTDLIETSFVKAMDIGKWI